MSGERLPNLSNMEGNSGDGNPRPRSLSVIDREIELVTRALEISDEAHRLRMARIDLEIDRMDAEVAGLIAQVNLDGPSNDTVLNPPNSLDLGPPNVPMEDPLDDNVPAPLLGAGTRFVDQLPDITLDDLPADSRSCHICLDSYGSPENPIRLPCGHVVGRSCISRWLATSNSCPLCRRVLFARNAAASETEIRALLEWTGLPRDQIDVAVEFIDITRRHVEVEMRLDEMEAENAPLTPERRRELGELMVLEEGLDERLRDVRPRLEGLGVRFELAEIGRER